MGRGYGTNVGRGDGPDIADAGEKDAEYSHGVFISRATENEVNDSIGREIGERGRQGDGAGRVVGAVQQEWRVRVDPL